MKDRYYMFRKMLDFVNEDFEVTSADIKTFIKTMVVEGTCPEGTIRIEVLPREEEQKDA